MTDAVIARGLVKRYGTVKALDGIDLTVPQGSVLGLLGPNGASKTTTVRSWAVGILLVFVPLTTRQYRRSVSR